MVINFLTKSIIMKMSELSILALILLMNCIIIDITSAFNGSLLTRISNQRGGVVTFVQKKAVGTTFSSFNHHAQHGNKSGLNTSADDEAAAAEEERIQHDSIDELSESATDILNSPAFLKRKLELLKEDVLKVETDIAEIKVIVEEGKAEWGERLDQLDKEFINIQERLIKQTSESGGKALIEVARKLLDVIDNYDRAFKSVTPSNDDETAIEADYKKSYDSIISTFKQLGIEQLDTIGQEFDYEKHQAVFTRPSEYEEGVICEELATGWVLGDQLIRPAMVCVSQ